MQRRAVLGSNRAEFGRGMAGEEGRIGVIALDPVLLDPRDLLAVRRCQIGLRRLVRAGTGDVKQPPLAIHAGRIGEGGVGEQLGRRRAVEPGAVDLLGQHSGGRLISEGPRLLVHADQRGCGRGATGELLPCPAGIAVEMPVAVTLGPPQQAAVLEEAVIVREVDPVVGPRGALGEPDRACARGRIDPQHVHLRLRTVLPLDIDRRGIGRPVDAGDIDVEIKPEIDLHAGAAVGVHYVKLDHGIVGARCRIALVEHLGALRPDRRAGDDADAGFIRALDDDAAVIGRPPISLEPRHFLLRDEFGLAPADRLGLACRGDRLGFAAHRAGPQPPVAHEGDIAALARQLGVEFGAFGVGQAGDGSVEPRKIEIAVERHQHARPVARPLIGNDALEPRHPRAFALHLLVFGQLAARSQCQRIHQHPPFAGLDVVAPQVIAVAIIGAVPEQGEIAPVGRESHLPRRGAIKAGRGEDALEGEHGGSLSHGGRLRQRGRCQTG